MRTYTINELEPGDVVSFAGDPYGSLLGVLVVVGGKEPGSNNEALYLTISTANTHNKPVLSAHAHEQFVKHGNISNELAILERVLMEHYGLPTPG